MPTIRDRLQHAWSAFRGRDAPITYQDTGPETYLRPDRPRMSMRGSDKSIVTAVFNRIAMDVAAVSMRHVRVDENGRYMEDIKSGLNECLTVEANLDQTGRAFMQDLVLSMLDEGVVAVVPVIATTSPIKSASYDIKSMRVAKIIGWRPSHVKVLIYDETQGRKREFIFPKSMVAIIENPLYAVINEPNSTLQRLVSKLGLLDVVDQQAASGKLDLLIQLPYAINSDRRREQAEVRRKTIEDQLTNTKYGVAYTDSTEKVVQLNRSLTNNLLDQVEYLTKMLYGQLGLTEEVFNGLADEKAMLNYNNRTLEPILSTIAEEFKRKFLTKTARTQGQSIMFFREPFKIVPLANLADIFDKLLRNEVLSSNDARAILGYMPSSDPRADELSNKNMPAEDRGGPDGMMEEPEDIPPEAGDDEDYGESY